MNANMAVMPIIIHSRSDAPATVAREALNAVNHQYTAIEIVCANAHVRNRHWRRAFHAARIL